MEAATHNIKSVMLNIIAFEMYRILIFLAALVSTALSQSTYCNYDGMTNVKIVTPALILG